MEVFASFATLLVKNQPENYHHQLPKCETFSQPTILRNSRCFIHSRIHNERDFIHPQSYLVTTLDDFCCVLRHLGPGYRHMQCDFAVKDPLLWAGDPEHHRYMQRDRELQILVIQCFRTGAADCCKPRRDYRPGLPGTILSRSGRQSSARCHPPRQRGSSVRVFLSRGRGE
jgi:hypothetical protein